jgi:DNA-directed RNA polymerase specialized sigma24 family protein
MKPSALSRKGDPSVRTKPEPWLVRVVGDDHAGAVVNPERKDAPLVATVDRGIDASGNRDAASLELLFRTSFDRLVRMVSLITDDAADAVQDAFVEAYRRWDEVGAYEDPLMWIRRVAVNKARDRARHRRNERALPHDLESDREGQLPAIRRAIASTCRQRSGGFPVASSSPSSSSTSATSASLKLPPPWRSPKVP